MLRIIAAVLVVFLAGCAMPFFEKLSPARPSAKVESLPSSAYQITLEGYKQDVAKHIAQHNNQMVYATQPQALLRSVVVIRYVVDSGGNVVKSEIMRSNQDSANEKTALASLRHSNPLPKPALQLLRQGRLELSESWLFNNDGRFQLRSIALPQMNE